MPLQLVTDPAVLSDARESLRLAFLNRGVQPSQNNIGWRGGSTPSEVYWDTDAKIWYSGKGDTEKHYWNAFGIDNPESYKMLTIHSEINFPFSGVNRSLAGAIARTPDGALVLTHSGRIGGGAKGVGKDLFWDRYSGLKDLSSDGESERPVAIVGILDSPNFLSQISSFVHEIKRIKASVSSTPTSIFPLANSSEFRQEYEGRKAYVLQKEIRSEHRHATITNRLSSILRLKSAAVVVNNQLTDIFLRRHDETTVMFEVKPDSSTTSVYGAVGQLLFHSVDLQPRPRLVFVAPDSLSREQQRKIMKLGIELLLFGWANREPVFQAIDQKNF